MNQSMPPVSLKIKLISFADGDFSARGEAFRLQAEKMSLFSTIEIHHSGTLDSDYFSQHRNFMESNEKGFGFYIWKSQVIKQSMRDASNYDLLCWMDVGFTLNLKGINRFLEYLEIAKSSPFHMLSFANMHTENKWTKSDLAIRLNVLDDPLVMNSSQLSSGFFIFAPNKTNAELINEWSEIATMNNYHYSSNSPSIHPNHELFIQHRHDQSIFSLLRKISGYTSTFYEVQTYAPFKNQYDPNVPAWATRAKQ